MLGHLGEMMDRWQLDGLLDGAEIDREPLIADAEYQRVRETIARRDRLAKRQSRRAGVMIWRRWRR
ncbi:MAG TPA: hypothetical protein VJ650_18145 [Gemmatimonadaceae bacterium]|nr:hypothetical protein [Gemmatimonadaceae bacterium]